MSVPLVAGRLYALRNGAGVCGILGRPAELVPFWDSEVEHEQLPVGTLVMITDTKPNAAGYVRVNVQALGRAGWVLWHNLEEAKVPPAPPRPPPFYAPRRGDRSSVTVNFEIDRADRLRAEGGV